MTLFDVARKNIKGNFRQYGMYFASMLLSVMIYYVFVSLQYSTDIIQAVELSDSIKMVFMIASLILVAFVLIFVSYSSQYFARTRKREVGLYALLGLPKRTIGRMLFYENIIIGIIVLVLGMTAGTLLSKLFGMILVRLLGIHAEVGLNVSLPALSSTVIVFMVIILVTSVRAYRIIYRFKLIELFRAEKEGEPEPRTSALTAVLAVACLAAGYSVAFRDFNDNQEIMLHAGIMSLGIVVGTQLFFSSFVLFMLKAAKRHKRGYYRGMNLVMLSSLVYRMKSNARSLGVISLLSAASLCAFSFGFASYSGYEHSVRMTAPFSYMYIAQDDAYRERIDSIITDDAAHPVLAQVNIPVILLKGEASSTVIISERDREAAEFPIKIVSASDYDRVATILGYPTLDGIESGEAIAVRPLYTDLTWADYTGQTVTLALPDEPVTLHFTGMTVNRIVNWSYPDIMVVVSDDQYDLFETKVQPVTYAGYIVKDQQTTKETSDALANVVTPESMLSTFYSEYRLGIESAALNVFILGFLGLVFVSALGSIITFKQLTETGEDQPRYDILDKIGVSKQDIGALIVKQSALIFLLPLLVGVAHYLIVLQWLKKLYSGLGDVGLAVPIVICIAIFASIYAAYFVLTVHSIQKQLLGESARSIKIAMLVIGTGIAVVVACMLLYIQPPASEHPLSSGEKLTLTLPEPAGPYSVGTVEVHLKDDNRADPWSGRQPRELMLSVWYPAAEAGGQKALYMQPGAAAYYDATELPTIGIDAGRIDLSGINTHAWLNAPAAETSSGWPVILYSPGASIPRSFGTILVSELASRGYVVVTVDHTHEAAAVQFPDGRVLTGQRFDMDADTVWNMLEVRVDDVRYVVDQLTAIRQGDRHDAVNLRLPEGLVNTIDLSRLGIFGHSAGGATSAQAMHEDARFDAGINMDGSLGYMPDHLLPVAQEGLDRPFMLFHAGYNDSGIDSHLTAADRGLFWEHSKGWKLDVSIPHGGHFSLTDHQYMMPELSSRLSLSARVLEGSVGTADREEVLDALRAYVTAFFDLHLKNIRQPLLESETPPYAVVEVFFAQ